jgi:hypothetical protein
MTTAAPSVALPPPMITQEDINTWYLLQQQLADVKDKEMALRKKIFAATFTQPKEGTNTQALTKGWVMKGQYKVDRKVEVAALTTLSAELREHGIPVDELISYKPELQLATYRALTDAQRAEFDKILIIKPGAPSLEIMLPKKGIA